MDIAALRARQQQARENAASNNGPGWFGLKEPGHFLVYICRASSDMAQMPIFGPVYVHYKVGRGDNRKMHLCLAQNEWLWSDEFRAALDTANAARRADGKEEWVVNLPTQADCPTCAEMTNIETTYTDKELEDMKAQEFWALNVILWAKEDVNHTSRIEVPPTDRVIQMYLAKPSIAMAGSKGNKAIADILCEMDVTDPKGATLVVLTRTGTEWKSTRYAVAADLATTRSPIVLDKHVKALLADTEPGQPSNLLGNLARLLRSPDSVRDLINPPTTNVPVSRGNGQPACYGKSCDPDDAECVACPFRAPCSKICGVREPGSEEVESPVQQVRQPQRAAPVNKPAPTSAAPQQPVQQTPASRPAPGGANPSRPASRPAPTTPARPATTAPVVTGRPAAPAVRSAAPVDDFAEELEGDEPSAEVDDLEAELDAAIAQGQK